MPKFTIAFMQRVCIKYANYTSEPLLSALCLTSSRTLQHTPLPKAVGIRTIFWTFFFCKIVSMQPNTEMEHTNTYVAINHNAKSNVLLYYLNYHYNLNLPTKEPQIQELERIVKNNGIS